MLDLAELDSAKKKLEAKKPKRKIDHAAHPPEGEEADHLVTRILPGQDLFENRLSACEWPVDLLFSCFGGDGGAF